MEQRQFDFFFGADPTRRFWEALAVMGIPEDVNGVAIDLREFRGNLPSFAASLARALEILITDGEGVSRGPYDLRNEFDGSLRRNLNPQYREVHDALSGLSDRFPYVWVQGGGNYGIRVAHSGHNTGVSLVTYVASTRNYPDRLKIGQRRWTGQRH